MTFSLRRTLALTALLQLAVALSGVQTVSAQATIPPTPPAPSPTTPPVAPVPSTPGTPTPGTPTPPPPTPPSPEMPELPPVPAEPTPTPALEPVPTPAPATPAAPVTPPKSVGPPAVNKLSPPLLINVAAQWPALVGGKVTTVPFTRTLTIPGARMAQIRERGGLTASLEGDLRRFLAELPTTPQDARFEELWDGWAVVQRNGLKLDAEKTRANVLAAILDPQAVKAEVAVVGQVVPKRTLEFFRQHGLTTHLGTGETNYYGSSAARVKNIHVGASRFKDRLLDSKVVSFNQLVGPISVGAGFVTGLVIAGERTADGIGGGICQVSTTVFRTLYSAGLPILERQNHSYQVRYYDPQGLDATIYQPKLDLKFANDTGGKLWFQSEWDDRLSKLSISVFGGARDFSVEIGAPRTLKTTPSPADRLLQDASLSVGQKKQVDWAAPGAVIEVTRRFVRQGQVFKQDTLRSVYRPWPNIFLVGTRR